MYAGRRITVLRVTALGALLVSAILAADSLHPGRAFCPVAAACEKARSSALGTIFGIPTSVLGMVSFGGLFLVSLLRVERSRPLLRPAGVVAAAVGAGLFAYQGLVLRSFCPLCLVADTAGLVAGLVVLTWPKTPVRRSGKPLAAESLVARLRWTGAAAAIVVAPFVWPRPERPSWVPIPEGGGTEIDAFDDPVPAAEAPPDDGPPPPTPPYGGDRLPPPPPDPTGRPPEVFEQVPPASVVPLPPPRPPSPPPPPPPVRPTPVPAAPRADLSIVEYLNAFCGHCRSTHARLDRVLADEGLVARRRRVYTWSSPAVPLWARAVAYAQSVGLEERMFEELVRAASETPQEVYAAAARAGLDPDAVAAAAADPRIPARLDADRRAFQGARLEGLPTLDIGRRRLMGEQSEAELREAVRAAVVVRSAPR